MKTRIRLISDPEIRSIKTWSRSNQGCYERFRIWLKDSSYSEAAINLYSAAARQIIGFLQKPYWQIDPEVDLERVKQYLESLPVKPGTRLSYLKGFNKFAEYLRLWAHRAPKPKEIRWQVYLGLLPIELQGQIREFVRHCQNRWSEDKCFEHTVSLLSHTTMSLRWMVTHYPLHSIANLTPELWFAYLDQRLAQGVQADTVNGELSALKHLVHFLEARDHPICTRFLLLDSLANSEYLPKDIAVSELRLLQKTIEAQRENGNAGERRLGRMDLA